MATAERETDHREKAERRTQKELLKTLGELGGAAFAEEDVERRGDKLVIPDRMTPKQAMRFLAGVIEREEETTIFRRTFRYRPWDGAMCTWNCLRRTFGAVGHKARTVDGFFGAINFEPELITVEVAPGVSESVPWGTFTVPYLPNVSLTLGAAYDNDFGQVFSIEASGPRKYRHQVEGLFRLIEEELVENSIYRGKAIDGATMPNFIDLTAVERRKVHYTEEVLAQLEANINSPLMYAQQHRELRVPLKRAVLIHGPYGTGKTLAAYLTGQVATANGWTFLIARPGRDNLTEVMQTARLYQPAVVFFEDMDNVASEDSTADQMTMMLDVFDGITAKGTEIMVILTTNHPERIHKGMLRAGRLDAVIEIGSLDRPAVEGMVKTISPKGKLDPDIDYDRIYVAMEGLLPAFIKEAIDRAIRYALARTAGQIEDIRLTTDDFVHAAHGLRPQLDMMSGAKETKGPDSLAQAVNSEVARAIRSTVSPRLLAED